MCHGTTVLVPKSPLFYSIAAPECKGTGAGNWDTPKRRHQLLPSNEKVRVFDLIREEKKSHAEVAELYSKNKASMCDTVKKEKEIHLSFAIAPQIAKVTATVYSECLAKMEKALSL